VSALESLTTGGLDWLVRAAWQSAVLTILVLLAQRLFGNRLTPRWRCALWLIVVARLVLPPLSLPGIELVGDLPWWETETSAVAVAPSADLPEAGDTGDPWGRTAGAEGVSPAGEAAPAPDRSGSEPSPAPTGEAAPVESGGPPVGLLFTLLWLTGVVGLAVITIVSEARTLRRLGREPSLDDERIADLVARCCREAGIGRRIVVQQGAGIVVPAVVGVFRPRLLLPPAARMNLTPAQLRLVVHHELEHVRHHDVAQNWLLHAVLCLHWMNPLAWFAVRRLQSSRETVRDLGVLGRVRASSGRDYGLTILRIVECSSRVAAGPARVAILESSREVKRRIAMLARYEGRQPRGLLTGMLLTVALTLAAAVGASERPAFAAAKPEKVLTGSFATEHFDVRYRPGSRAGATADRDAARAELDLRDICAKLEFTPTGRFTMYIYDDAAELQVITGMSGVGAFSSGRVTHVPKGDDQTRYHEIAHLVTARLPKPGKEARNMFFPEGMANALLRFVHGVHVHATAKFHRTRKTLPPLADLMQGDFYAWQRAHPKVSAYDIAGSFLLFLLETYGAGPLKLYYGGTSAKRAFGKSEKQLEAAWLGMVDGFVIRAEVETLLRQRSGEDVKFTAYTADPDARLPAEVLGKPGDWRSLVAEKLRPQDDATWKREGNTIVGTFEGTDWHVVELGTRKFGDCVVRAKIRTENILGGVQLRLGPGCCAMLVGNGTFVWSNDRGIAMSPEETVRPTGEVDFTMVRKAGKLEVYVDGVLLTEGAVDATKHPVGIGFHCGQGRGTARFSDVRVRMLP